MFQPRSVYHINEVLGLVLSPACPDDGPRVKIRIRGQVKLAPFLFYTIATLCPTAKARWEKVNSRE